MGSFAATVRAESRACQGARRGSESQREKHRESERNFHRVPLKGICSLASQLFRTSTLLFVLASRGPLKGSFLLRALSADRTEPPLRNLLLGCWALALLQLGHAAILSHLACRCLMDVVRECSAPIHSLSTRHGSSPSVLELPFSGQFTRRRAEHHDRAAGTWRSLTEEECTYGLLIRHPRQTSEYMSMVPV